MGASVPTGCAAPTGNYASDPSGGKTAELFVETSGAGSGWRCDGSDQRRYTNQSTRSVTTPDAGTVTQTINMLYNDGGQVTGLVYPDGETLTSTYDLNGRLRSLSFGTPQSTDPVPFLVGQVSYTNDGQTAGMAIGGMAPKASVPTPVFSTATTSDAIQRPLSTSATEAGQTIWSQTRAYDNEGNRVLSNSSNASSTTDTISFDGYTETVLSGGSRTTTTYYSANCTRIAVRVDGSTLDYLVNDPLGSNSVALNNLGQVIALQHHNPYQPQAEQQKYRTSL